MSNVWRAGIEPSGLLSLAGRSVTPVGQVIGNGVFMPIIVGLPSASMEVSSASLLATKGWTEALARLRERAAELGADGVVDIQLNRRVLSVDSATAEFSAIGTAVRGLRQRQLWTSNLTGEEIAALAQGGFGPVALAVGCCTWFQSFYGWQPKYRKGIASGLWAPQEVRPATTALSTARSVAVEKMDRVAKEAGATGIVGVDMKFGKPRMAWPDGVTAACEAFGTAIAPIGADSFNPEIAVPLY